MDKVEAACESAKQNPGEENSFRQLRLNQWVKQAVRMVQNLEDMGFTVVPFGQGFKDMSPPTKELMKLTLEQKIDGAVATIKGLDRAIHCGNSNSVSVYDERGILFI